MVGEGMAARSPSPEVRTASSRFARLSLHLPNVDLRPQHLVEAANPVSSLARVDEHDRSRASSVYEDDNEWNRRISSLIVPSTWHISDDIISTVDSGRIQDEVITQHDGEHAKITEDSPYGTLPETRVLRVEVSRDLRTRNICVVALVLGILVGVALLAAGCQIVTSGRVLLPGFLLNKVINMGTVDYPFPGKTAKHYLSGHRVVPVPEFVMLMISFVLNICLTILFDCMAFIQNTTLRWALCKEGRLVYNSNPRLFTGARHFAPNWRTTNAVSAVALVLGYGSISTLTCSIYVVGMSNGKNGVAQGVPITGPKYAIDFNGWGFVGLGISLLLQGAISCWCLVRSKIVPTWSSNPFNTALVCAILGLAEQNRAVTPKPRVFDVDLADDASKRLETKLTWLTLSEESDGMVLVAPKRRQSPMRVEVPRSRRFTYVTWGVFAFTVLWVIIVAAFGVKTRSCTHAYVAHMNDRVDFLAYWQTYCQVRTPYYINPFLNRRDWLGLIIQCIVFSVITLGLHCAEILTDIARDEYAWRKASTTGADAGRGALIEGTTSWVCWLTFGFKSLTPWMFGMAFNTNLEVFHNLIPLSVLSFIMLLLALFSEFLVRRRPKGPQPSTWGNISRLAGLVDEWHPRIFWGDKGAVEASIRKAGTAGRRLADVDMSMLYANLQV